MFALLEHRVPLATPGAASTVHWDFLIEVPGGVRLATWRLEKDPTRVTDPIGAERIQDHRRIYLDYEGPVSGNRGHVKRLDRGDAIVRDVGEREVCVELRGARLRGLFEVVSSGGTLVFRRASRRDTDTP